MNDKNANSNYDREKAWPNPGFFASKALIPRTFANKFFRDPAFPSRWGYGSSGSNNIPYTSPHWSAKSKGKWRTCRTSPDERTADSCEIHIY